MRRLPAYSLLFVFPSEECGRIPPGRRIVMPAYPGFRVRVRASGITDSACFDYPLPVPFVRALLACAIHYFILHGEKDRSFRFMHFVLRDGNNRRLHTLPGNVQS